MKNVTKITGIIKEADPITPPIMANIKFSEDMNRDKYMNISIMTYVGKPDSLFSKLAARK